MLVVSPLDDAIIESKLGPQRRENVRSWQGPLIGVIPFSPQQPSLCSSPSSALEGLAQGEGKAGSTPVPENPPCPYTYTHITCMHTQTHTSTHTHVYTHMPTFRVYPKSSHPLHSHQHEWASLVDHCKPPAPATLPVLLLALGLGFLFCV